MLTPVDHSLLAEISTLARVMSHDTSAETTLMLLKAFPPKDDMVAAFTAIDDLLNTLLASLLAEDNQARYPEVLALVCYEMFVVDSLGVEAPAEISQKYAKTFFFFLEFMVDYQANILASMKLLAKLSNVQKNQEVGLQSMAMLAKYTEVESFHKKLSIRILDNIEESNYDQSLSTLKDLLSTFANLATIYSSSGVEEIIQNFINLTRVPLAIENTPKYSTSVSQNKNETFRRCNSLQAFLIDVLHLLQESKGTFEKFEAATYDLIKKLINERTTTYESYSNCNIMRVILFYFERTKNKDELSEFLHSSITYQTLVERMLLSKDAEDIKYSFHYLQSEVDLIKQKDLKKIWSNCVNLLSTLDSFGKYLIEPQWIGIITPLLSYLETEDHTKSKNLDLFWMFQILATKAMQHENPIVIRTIMMHILDSDLNLEVYSSLIVDSLLPSIDNTKLYDDVAGEVDLHPKLGQSLRRFFAAASQKYPQVIAREFEHLASRVHDVESFNAKASAWHVFGGIYEAGLKAPTFDDDLLEKIVYKAAQTAFYFPPYRRSIFVFDFVSFIGCLPLTLKKWLIVSKLFSEDYMQELYFHQSCRHIRSRHVELLAKDKTLLIEIVASMKKFASEMKARFENADASSHIYLWQFQLFFNENLEQDPFYGAEFLSEIRSPIEAALFALFEEVERMNNNPYIQQQQYNNVVVVFMRRVLETMKEFRSMIAKPEVISAICTAFLNVSAENFGHREVIEEALYALRIYLDDKDQRIVGLVNKLIRTSLSRFNQFLQEPYIKEDEIAEQTKSYKADILLLVGCSLMTWLIEKEAAIEDETLILHEVCYRLLSQTKTGVRVQNMLKATTVLYFEYFKRAELIDSEKVKEYLADCSHVTIVTKFNRYALNKIFNAVILPAVQADDDKVAKFYKVTMDAISRNRNTLLSYYIFESFLVVSLEEASEAKADFLCTKLIDVCEIENSAFRLRRIAAMMVKFMLVKPEKIGNVYKLLAYLLVKEETRPRDASILIDVREFVYENGMFDELAEEMTVLNSYSAFPRLFVACCLERVFNRFHTYDEATREQLDLLACRLYEGFFYGYFTQANSQKSLKPFEEKHKAIIRKFHVLIAISNHFKHCSPSLT